MAQITREWKNLRYMEGRKGMYSLTDRNSELGRVTMLGFRIKVNSGSATKFWDHLRKKPW